MNPAHRRADRVMALIRFFLIALPILSFILSVWSWLRFGMDIPVYDDWRQYNANDMGRLDLAYLFTPHNDTLYTVGLLLDSLAFRLLDGNTVAYQLLSIVFVLGGLLLLQWLLLRKLAASPHAMAIAFSFTLLMLQPDTYWGWQNLAYHQAIPLICTLGIFSLTLGLESQKIAKLIGILCLGFIAGLSYISGAFSILALCGTSFAVGLLSSHVARRKFISAGLALTAPAIITTAAQLWVIVEVQHGTHRADAPMAFPWESDFWLFLLGKIARSLMLPMEHATISLAVTTIVVMALIAVAFKSLIILGQKKIDRAPDSIYIFLSLCAIVFLYLLLISAGRTNLRPDDVDTPLEIFSYGFYRFHFFWVTLIWPWAACLILNWLIEQRKLAYLLMPLSVCTVALWLACFKYTSIIDSDAFFKATMIQRMNGISCIQDKIQLSGSVQCSSVDLGDIEQGIKNGRIAGASFARNLHLIPITMGSDSPRPAYRLSENLSSLEILHATKISSIEPPIALKSDIDPSLIFSATNDIANCSMLEVSASLISSDASIAQLFYLTKDDIGFNEAHSVTTRVAGSPAPQQINLSVSSDSGFKQSLRFDPVIGSQDLTIIDLEVRCRAALKNN